jgi:hypothetical protein
LFRVVLFIYILGNGGNAGLIEYHVNNTNGIVRLTTCAGKGGSGGQPGNAGKG